MSEQESAFEAWYSRNAYTIMNTIEFDFCDGRRDEGSATILKEWVKDAWLSGFYHGYIDQFNRHGSLKGTTENRH